MRIGARISDGLSEEQLAEFDLISDSYEAAQWLVENRPDYREIVVQTELEMERGVILEE